MAEDRCLLTESGIYLAFSDQKAQKTLNKVMRTEKKMVRRMATTLKVPVASGLLKDEKFTFQRKIQKLVTWHKIQKESIIKFGQTPLSYNTVGDTSFEFPGVQSVPVIGGKKGKQITGTFSITTASRFFSHAAHLLWEDSTLPS